MRFSASSLIITIIISCILILFLEILLSNKKNYKLFRTDFLTVLILVIIFRLFFPFEFGFTTTIKLPLIMNPIIDFLQYNIYANIQTYQVLLSIWIVGFIYNLIYWILEIKNTKSMYKRIEKSARIYSIKDFIKSEQNNDYPILKSSLISSCMVMGFNKAILIPSIPFSKTDIKNVLLHEIQHIKNHDIYIKQIINLLVIIYWWFIPIYRLKNKINLFLEMRVDNQVTKGYSKQETLNYMKTLINVQNELSKCGIQDEIKTNMNTLLILDDSQILSYRINYLLDGMFKNKTNPLLMALVFLMPLFTNSIIFESEFEIPKEEGIYEQSDVESGYIIKHKDGTFELVIRNKSLGTIENPYDECFEKVPIIEEEEIGK